MELNAKDFLNGLKRETKLSEKKVEPTSDVLLKPYIDFFESCLKERPHSSDILSKMKRAMLPAAQGHDITRLSTILGKYQQSKGFQYQYGVFMSGLITNTPSSNILIVTTDLEELPEYLQIPISGQGWDPKQIRIEGSWDSYLGYKSVDEILITGNVGHSAAEKNLGSITILGDAKDEIGLDNRGTVTIHGNALDVKNGSGIIHLLGEHYKLSRPYLGTIYHKGKLLAKDERLYGKRGTMITHSDDFLKGLKREHSLKQSKTVVSKNPRLEQLIAGFEKVHELLQYEDFPIGQYPNCEALAPVGAQAEDIALLATYLGKYDTGQSPLNWIIGLYLSAAINTSEGEQIIIPTNHFQFLSLVGYNNSKLLTLDGNVYGVGRDNTGTIHINGEKYEINTHPGTGDIYHNGKLIVANGKLVGDSER